MRFRHVLRGASLAVATAAIASVSLAAPAIAAPGSPGEAAVAAGKKPAPVAGPSDINGYRAVGYLMADSPVTRDYQVADLLRTGALDDLTHLNYAFGNVTADLTCDITTQPGEGDAFNDYLRLVSKQDSVDGKHDKPKDRLSGNFNQLRKLKEVSPDTKILISLGGWTWSDHFSEATATPERRAALVESCIDLYLRGNLPVIDGKGGQGAAAGIFDGIDVDWEWPVRGGETPNASPDDAERFLALMEEFRAQLDALGAETGEDYLLTAFAPAGGWNRDAGGWLDPRLFAAVDFLNVQGYDYHGGWVPNLTGHQGNLHPDGTQNWGLALDNSVEAFLAAGARPEQLNAGLAAYGQGWTGVENGAEAWQPATASIGTKPYFQLRDVGEEFFDAEVGAAWRYDAATGEWWSLDTPASVEAKAEWVASEGYGGAMWWDVSGDWRNELGDTLGDTLRGAAPGPLD
ncbi:glycoside hydrolase family 18 protein [Agromyces sp. G08B096]|uniref:chitinase n=1 Tax=Agromyces sp. G08B096 TaxID=3156399 RepID=A0AAU7WBB5_9MICO